ncbi:hypothetical protein BaRGS_00035610, partial [Batillaria attramentaria]
YDLVTDDSGVVFRYTIGRAVVGTLCDGGGRSVSVVEDRGALGALHDGAGNTCRASDRFLMAGGTSRRTQENKRNPWFFSSCSAREIARFVRRTLDNRGERQCLLTALPQVGVPDVRGVIPGQLYNPHEQCQHIYGPQSRYCFGGNFGDLGDICTSMFCLNPREGRRNFCVQHHAAHGTSCGNGKWCEDGACVANQNAPSNLGQCPLGDQLLMLNGRPCPEAVAARPALCYNRRVRNICCGTCARSANENSAPGCPFGDRARGCNADLCNTLWPDGTVYAERCCRTCQFDPSRWTCADTQQGVDGLSCADAVWRDGVQGCYNVTLAFLCCDTCSKLRNARLQTGCEYGDLVPGTCNALGAKPEQCSPQIRRQCCATCASNDVTGTASQLRLSHEFFYDPCTPLAPKQIIHTCYETPVESYQRIASESDACIRHRKRWNIKCPPAAENAGQRLITSSVCVRSTLTARHKTSSHTYTTYIRSTPRMKLIHCSFSAHGKLPVQPASG